jgi:predicted O-methyltransferase YrrM
MRDLAVLIPTRGRPGNVRKVISAWDFTNGWDRADMVLVIDQDDPEYPGYLALVEETRHPDSGEPLIKTYEVPAHVPMVHKLNDAARALAPGWFALGFAGDDHLPQTIGWAERYLTVLRELGSGVVYGDDGYQGRKLSTEWAVTSDAVLALDRMVPADVEHMYCDNAMMDLYGEAGCLVHLPEVRIEHMHPAAGKAETDEQYQRVNHRDQFSKDRRAYEGWRHGDVFLTDVATVRHLRKGRPEVTNEIPAGRPRVAGSAPRPLRRGTSMRRSGPSSARRTAPPSGSRPPASFRNVRAATPEDVMIALADFASQVPADQEIVELGVFQGRTALQLAWGAGRGHGAHVTAIDPWDLPGNVYDPPFTDEGSRTWARHWVDSLGYADKIRLVHGFSQDVALTWDEVGDNRPVGLLYVDGDHTKDGAKLDILSWAPHLAPGARIAVDDYGHPDWPGVGEAVDELVTEGFLEPIEIYHDRMAVTRLAQPGRAGSGDLGDRVTAITSEGIAPPPVTGRTVPIGPAQTIPMDAQLLLDMPEPDTEVSSEDRAWKVAPGEAIAADVPLGPVTDLNTVQLRALARHRGIVLGVRKDKRNLILQALREGR